MKSRIPSPLGLGVCQVYYPIYEKYLCRTAFPQYAVDKEVFWDKKGSGKILNKSEFNEKINAFFANTPHRWQHKGVWHEKGKVLLHKRDWDALPTHKVSVENTYFLAKKVYHRGKVYWATDGVGSDALRYKEKPILVDIYTLKPKKKTSLTNLCEVL